MIQIEHITKQYQQQKAVNDVSFTITEGICTALIGPNGSGKSTLIDLLIGDRHADSGMSKDPSHLLHPERLGVLFQRTTFPERMKVIELYQLFSKLYPQSLSLAQFQNITRFNDVELQKFATELSGGQQRILDFALTMISKPQCLILDEPTSAMDVQMRQHFWKIVSQLKAEGLTLFYTSHYIEEVERMADQVIVLNKGQIVFNDSPGNIKQQQHLSIIDIPAPHIALEQQFPHETITHVQQRLHIKTNHVQQVLEKLLALNVNLDDIEIRKNSLLEIIFNEDKQGEDQ
ncbi:ABC transporter ATP-binding protein [Staphylococcus schleiferi]|uniref:ABC transporter ATP-binding protein n=1 Tax=Staphylococcus schleiferi TaxID=1295 RepID=UPI001430197A|nr:ABC transporter ATP-binding protein [Staphylococcus schleiferi]NHA42187.1 antibiotic ABC transporter ATP-binding protein [Staphylococcus schleiferi]